MRDQEAIFTLVAEVVTMIMVTDTSIAITMMQRNQRKRKRRTSKSLKRHQLWQMKRNP